MDRSFAKLRLDRIRDTGLEHAGRRAPHVLAGEGDRPSHRVDCRSDRRRSRLSRLDLRENAEANVVRLGAGTALSAPAVDETGERNAAETPPRVEAGIADDVLGGLESAQRDGERIVHSR